VYEERGVCERDVYVCTVCACGLVEVVCVCVRKREIERERYVRTP